MKAHIDGIEVACCIANDTQTRRRRCLLKQPPEVVSLGIDGDGGHRLGLDQGVIDGRGGQVARKLQKALLIRRAVVSRVARQIHLHMHNSFGHARPCHTSLQVCRTAMVRIAAQDHQKYQTESV